MQLQFSQSRDCTVSDHGHQGRCTPKPAMTTVALRDDTHRVDHFERVVPDLQRHGHSTASRLAQAIWTTDTNRGMHNKKPCCRFLCLRCFGLTLFHLDAVLSTVRNATVQWLEQSASPPHGPRGVDPGYSAKRPVANSEAESGSGCLTPVFRLPADLENPPARPSGPPARNYFTPTVSPGSGRLTKWSGLVNCSRIAGIISA